MNRRQLLTLPGASLAAVFGARRADAHGYKAKSVVVSHPWTFAQDKAGVDAAIGMTLANTGSSPDALIGVETRDARSAEIVLSGKPAKRLELPAGGTVVLHGEGPHILLKSVRKSLVPYDNLHATLIFARAGRVRIEIVVEDRPA